MTTTTIKNYDNDDRNEIIIQMITTRIIITIMLMTIVIKSIMMESYNIKPSAKLVPKEWRSL